MTQNEALDRIATLRLENPTASVRFLVPSELPDDFPYYTAKIAKIEVDVVWEDEDRIYVGEDDIKEEIYNNLDEGLEDDVASVITDKRYGEWKYRGKIKTEIIVTMVV